MQTLSSSPFKIALCSGCDRAFSSCVGTDEFLTHARASAPPPPTLSTAALSDDLSRVCGDLDTCNREIDAVKSILSALCRRRTKIEATKLGIRSMLSPLRKVPPEILAEIAAYTLPEGWFVNQIGTRIWVFTQVCRSWREVALGMRWPWAHFNVSNSPFDRLSPAKASAVKTYLCRSGSSPLTVMGMHTNWDDGATDVLWSDIERIQTYEALCVYEEQDAGLDGRAFPALQRLIIRNASHGSVDAPKLRVVELFDFHALWLDLPWANLRALQLGGDFDAVAFPLELLLKCPNLEMLSVLCEVERLGSSLPQTITLPCLHTLEVAIAAVDALPLLVAPALRHFIFDMAYDFKEFLQNAFRPTNYSSLLQPVTCITLRNSERFGESLLTPIISVPKKLRKLRLIAETLTGPFDSVLHNLVPTLCTPSAYPCLTDVEIVNAHERARWILGDVALVQRLLESRAAPDPNLAAPLERLVIQAPHAALPAGLLAGNFAHLRTSSGTRILDMNANSSYLPTGPLQVSSVLSE